MKIFGGTKSLRNILGGLKSNVVIFRGTNYLFNPNFISVCKIKILEWASSPQHSAHDPVSNYIIRNKPTLKKKY